MPKPLQLFLFLSLPISLSAQITYHHYLDSSYVWFENYFQSSLTGPSPCMVGGTTTRYSRYHFIGEAKLDGYDWYQVHEDWVQDDYCANTGNVQTVSPSNNLPVFHVREDSLGRIFIRDANGGRMLYDFGGVSGIGDTLWMDDYTMGFAVDSIDTLYLGSEPHARYVLACNNSVGIQRTDIVYEGIGSNLGFNLMSFICLDIYDFELHTVCCEKDGDTLVLTPSLQCGIPPHNPVVGISDPALPSLQVHWSNNTQTLVLATDPQQAIEWKVVDMVGNVVRKGNETQSRIPLPDLAAGIYFFSATTAAQHCAYRFLVQM